MECSVLSLKMEDLIGETYFDIVGESRDNGKRFATTKSSHCRYKRCRCRTAQSAAEDILRRGEGGMRLSRGEARQKADRGKNPHRSASDSSEVLPSERNSNLLTSLKDIGRIFLLMQCSYVQWQEEHARRTDASGGMLLTATPMPATEHELSSPLPQLLALHAGQWHRQRP